MKKVFLAISIFTISTACLAANYTCRRAVPTPYNYVFNPAPNVSNVIYKMRFDSYYRTVSYSRTTIGYGSLTTTRDFHIRPPRSIDFRTGYGNSRLTFPFAPYGYFYGNSMRFYIAYYTENGATSTFLCPLGISSLFII